MSLKKNDCYKKLKYLSISALQQNCFNSFILLVRKTITKSSTLISIIIVLKIINR